MTQTVFIDGAAGTTGLEIVERLAPRAEFSLLVLDEVQRKSAAARRDAYHAADFAVLCLPDEAAIEAVAMAEGSKVRIIDASSAHRTAPGWTYGFPELTGRSKVAGANRVTNPGCYPTGFLALLAPLIRKGLLPSAWPYTCHAVSGYSGGGKKMIEEYEAKGAAAIPYHPYGLGFSHKHLPEMQVYAELAHAPIFQPAVGNYAQGMMGCVPVFAELLAKKAKGQEIRDCLSLAHANQPCISGRCLCEKPRP